MTGRLLLAAAAASLVVLAPAPVAADAPETSARQTATGATISVSSGSGRPSGAGGAGSTPSAPGRPSSGRPASTTTCANHDLLSAGFLAGLGGFFGTAIDSTTTSSVAWRVCTDDATGATTTSLTGLLAAGAPRATPAPAPPTAELVAALASAELHLDLPEVATAPPRAGLQLAGVRVWFWVEPDSRSATATIPGLSATVTARPAALTVRSPAAGSATCADGGGDHRTPLTAACTLTFLQRGRHEVEASLRWSLWWTATDGTAGSLPDVTRTATFPMVVSDGIALTD